jgi:hypothetical protein
MPWLPKAKLTKQSLGAITLFSHIGLMVAALACGSLRILDIISKQRAEESRANPERGVAFLKNRSTPPNIFGFYDWGGFIIWKLYPQQRVYLDGRADLYGDAILRQFNDTYLLRHDWKRGLEGACSVIVPPSSALAAGLRNNPSWAAIFNDNQAAIFERQPSSRPPCGPIVTTQAGKFHLQSLRKKARIYERPEGASKGRSAPNSAGA